MKMKAAVLHEHGKPLQVEEVDISPPRKGEVQMKIHAVAICHSDIHSVRGDLGKGTMPPAGYIGGHEVAGTVAAIGPGVTTVKVGDHIVASFEATNCGRCKYCLQGMPHLCINTPPMGKTDSGIKDKKGNIFEQGVGINGFAEYSLCDEIAVVKIPDDMPLDRAALLTCGFMTGFGAVVNRAQVRPMQSVAIMGIGGVGINALQGAVFSGAYPIIAVDTLDSKLAIAKKFGAHYGVNAMAPDAVEQVKKLTADLGVDFTFVTVGSLAAIRQGFNMLAPRGMLVNMGIVAGNLSIAPLEFTFNEKMITGCKMGSNRFRMNIIQYINLYKAGLIKLDELITGRYPIEKINEAMESVERGEAIRNVIVMVK